ncbi:MAG: Adenosylmethionine--8-amino-7-oxononanoate transaminase [Bacteroidota bacterium]|jgi:adenosylmethionine-8-amino-7-oxononanoate aminotransferase
MQIKSMSNQNLASRDAAVIWHPFTQHQIEPISIPIASGKGAHLFDTDGKKYIDAISSWWVNTHGHGHPYLAEKIYEQALQLEQVIFAGFTHEPAVQLSERLLAHLPANFERVFFSDNGSTAVEVAIKMALQFYHNQENTKRRKILAFQDAYHGDTFGAMSLGAPSSFNAPFQDMLFEVEFLPSPQDAKACIAAMSAADESYAAFIFEPLIQGAGGMKMYEASTLDTLIQIAREKGILCIADEIMTGFGRTGKWFAMDYLAQKPDIVCFSKGLTGGMMAMGLTLCSEQIFQSFLSDDRRKMMFHSHSFTANPLACAAANASLDLMEKEETWESIARVETRHREFAAKLADHSVLKNVRIHGTILAMEVETGEADGYLHSIRDDIYQYFLKEGILMRPLGNTIYILAPYCIEDEDLAYIYGKITAFAQGLI